MPDFLSRFIPVADAIARLFQPNVEVVIHALNVDRVHYIAHPFSGRRAGEESLLSLSGAELEDEEDVIGPYTKTGDKGQPIRSITVILRDDTGNARGLMCVNLDLSVYEPALDLLEALIRPPLHETHPEILFRNDWRDRIKGEIRSFIEEHPAPDGVLTADQRRSLIARLESKGLFYARKSVMQVAGLLGVSRATCYNDLQAIRKDAAQRNGRTS